MGETMLGVPKDYKWDKARVNDRETSYLQALDDLEDWYCKDKGIPDNENAPPGWQKDLPENRKNLLKMRLLLRTMTWVKVYREVDKDQKSNWPLFRQNIISNGYWQSIKNAEEIMEWHYEDIKKEAKMLEPGQDPNMIFREAVGAVDKYGTDDLAPPKKQPEPQREWISEDKSVDIQQTLGDIDLFVTVPAES